MPILISIIVPVYNSEKTLIKCLDSIMNQSLYNWELILINDGSKDGSREICDKYALNDRRIRVFHKENEGVSIARNLGLDSAEGKFVTFIDSDDWVDIKYLEHLVSHMNGDIDLVISYAQFYNEHGCRKKVYPEKIVADDNFESIFIDNDMHWHTSPWSKLYRMDIIRKNNLRFCEGMHIGEDALFLYSYILLSKKLYISSDTDYCYYETSQNSLTKRINNLSSELLSYRNIDEIINRIIELKKIKSKYALDRLGWLIACYQRRVLNSLYHDRVSLYNRLKILKNEKWFYYVEYIKNTSIKERILIFLLRYRLFVVYDCLRVLSANLCRKIE